MTTLAYDSAGHLTGTTDANTNSRTLEVDAAGRVTAMVDASTARTEFTYDAAGNRLTSKDAEGHLTSFGYDALGRLSRVTDALGHVTTTEYDAEGRVTARVDARGGRATTRYDAAGKVVETTGPDGARTTLGYCADVPEACAVVDASGAVTTRAFDAGGRVTKVTDALGRVTSQAYDSAGRLKASSGPHQASATYYYDPTTGLLGQVTNALGVPMQYGYDVRGNRTSVTPNASSPKATRYTYDAANRLLSETNPLNQVTSYTYDAAGNRATKTDGNGKLTTYLYDGNRRLKEVQFQDGTKYEYGYDARGSRTLEKSPSHERTLAYDELGRVAQVADVTQGKVLAFGYDDNGNRTRVTEGSLSHGYVYDAANRLLRATDGAAVAASFVYDAVGRRRAVVRGNGVRTDYGYDEAGQVKAITHQKGGVVLAGFAYEYDGAGNRLTKTDATGFKESYEYDLENRLTKVAYGTVRTVEYGLDALGNRALMDERTSSTFVRTGYVSNAFNQLVSSGGPGSSVPLTSYAYDLNGNLASETTGTSARTYAWDLDNRLRQVVMQNGAVSSFEYDANGLRTKKVEGGVVTRFVLDGASVFEELDSVGNTTTSYLTNPQVIDEILSFTIGGATYYPLADALGSAVLVADSSGAVVRTNSYDVYGARTAIGSGPAVAFGFAGREHDQTGLIKMRQRDLDPLTGRWQQPDIVGHVSGKNLYSYVESRPTMLTDPRGRWIHEDLTGEPFSAGRTFVQTAHDQLLATVWGVREFTATSFIANIFVTEGDLSSFDADGITMGRLSSNACPAAAWADMTIMLDPAGFNSSLAVGRKMRSKNPAKYGVRFPGGTYAHELGHAYAIAELWPAVRFNADTPNPTFDSNLLKNDVYRMNQLDAYITQADVLQSNASTRSLRRMFHRPPAVMPLRLNSRLSRSVFVAVTLGACALVSACPPRTDVRVDEKCSCFGYVPDRRSDIGAHVGCIDADLRRRGIEPTQRCSEPGDTKEQAEADRQQRVRSYAAAVCARRSTGSLEECVEQEMQRSGRPDAHVPSLFGGPP